MAPELLLACAAALVAGFIDAVAGGGGLVQLPALLVIYPNAQPEDLFGTNKVASMAGTVSALARYVRVVRVPWDAVGPAAALAFATSFVGARLAAWMPVTWMRPVVLVLLAAVFVQTVTGITRPRVREQLPPTPAVARMIALAMGGGLGLYDGFFGPGTGSFLLFGFVALLGMDFLAASASAKAVNVATNLAAILAFALGGHVRWELALPMAVCNVVGAQLGTRLALAQGAAFVRGAFVVVVGALLLRLGWQTFTGS